MQLTALMTGRGVGGCAAARRRPSGAHDTGRVPRRTAARSIDWIADYYERVESFPVLSQVAPGSIRAALPDAPPERGEPFDDVLRDLDDDRAARHHALAAPVVLRLLPGQRERSGDPRRPARVRPRRAGHALGHLAGRHRTRDARARLVRRAARPARAVPAPSGDGGGVIQHTASDAALVALLAALHRVSGGRTERAGVAAGRYAVYTSAQTHSSVEKACRIAGLGADALRKIDIDPATLAVQPTLLREAIEHDVRRGITPALVVASIGATGTGAVDPVRELAEIAHEHGAWLHVDGAWAGVAAVAPEFRWLNDGLDHADSYCTNPHKWLLTNFDCDAFWVADRAALVGALSILPEYLRNAATESGAVIDYRDWHVPLGRRFRALKLWAVIRWYGAEGLREHIRDHVGLAQEFASWVRGGRPVRAGRAARALAGDVPAARRRRRDPRADGRS